MENNSVKKAGDFLCENRLGVLSTISAISQKPQSCLIYYLVEGEEIYFITVKDSVKVNNILKNHQVALTISSEVPPLELQLEGQAEVINGRDIKRLVTKLYLNISKENPAPLNWPPIMKLSNIEGFEFFNIKVNWFKYSDFSGRIVKIIEGTAINLF